MWRIIFLTVVFGVLYWMVKQAFFPQRGRAQEIKKGEELVQDPVCKCYVPKSQAQVLDFRGEKVHFCSEECRKKYVAANTLPKS